MKIWDGITTIALILACVMTPYGLAFEDRDPQSSKDFFECKDTSTCLELWSDMIFIAEIFVTINTAVINPETNQYEMNRRKIFFGYLITWLPIDVVAVLPRFFRLL